jgi:hypothetical protein
MNDLFDLIRETFSGTQGMPPGLDEQALDAKVAALDRRTKTVGWITWLSVGVMAVLGLIMFVLLLSAEADTETSLLVLYGAVFVWSAVAIAMAKLWHFQMQSDAAAMKEILRIQAMLQASDQS